MKAMFTVLYLTIGFNGLSLSLKPCLQDPRSFTIQEVETIVYALAGEKGVPATVILNRLLRKARVKQRTEKDRPKNKLQEIALQELINSESSPRVPPPTIDIGGQPPHNRPPIMSSPPLPSSPNFDRDTVITAPIYPKELSLPSLYVERLPTIPVRQNNNLVAGMMLPPPGFPAQIPGPPPQAMFIPFQNLGPPPGVTVRVKAGANNIPEVTVTLSPMMTIVEALKQAESKFRSVLGFDPVSDDDIISFTRSSFAECYVIRSFDSIESTDNGYWKIIVNDISGKVIYDSVCLPSRSEVAVKPGMTITLLYTVV